MLIEFNVLQFEPIQQDGNVRLVVDVDLATGCEIIRQLADGDRAGKDLQFRCRAKMIDH